MPVHAPSSLPSIAREAGLAAAELGLEAWLVGGAVRDLMLSGVIRDVDVVIDGAAEPVARALARKMGGRAHINPAFRTAHVVCPDGEILDLATARSESYPHPGALPQVQPGDLAADLARRDFTINAMAIGLHPARLGERIDPHGGAADLAARRLRVLHPASFLDDPTRLWRALRFAVRLELDLERGTARLLADAIAAGAARTISLERTGAEISLLLAEARPGEAMRVGATWGLVDTLHSDLAADPALPMRVQAAAAWSRLRGLDPVASGWLCLSAALPESARIELARLAGQARHGSRRFVEGPPLVAAAGSALDLAQDQAAIGRALAPLDPAELALLAALRQDPSPVDWWWSDGRHIRCAVGGAALLARGFPPGPALGAALGAALDVARRGAPESEQWEAAFRLLDAD